MLHLECCQASNKIHKLSTVSSFMFIATPWEAFSSLPFSVSAMASFALFHCQRVTPSPSSKYLNNIFSFEIRSSRIVVSPFLGQLYTFAQQPPLTSSEAFVHRIQTPSVRLVDAPLQFAQKIFHVQSQVCLRYTIEQCFGGSVLLPSLGYATCFNVSNVPVF